MLSSYKLRVIIGTLQTLLHNKNLNDIMWNPTVSIKSPFVDILLSFLSYNTHVRTQDQEDVNQTTHRNRFNSQLERPGLYFTNLIS